MWRTTGIVLAASSIFLASSAAPPDPAPARPAVSTNTTEMVSHPVPEEPLEAIHPAPGADRAAALMRRALEVRPASSRRSGGICLAAGDESSDLCAAAARISYGRPCLAAGDCPALEDWKQVMGAPGVRPAPRSMVRAADRAPAAPESPERE